MLDIKLIRENPDLVKAAMKSRNKDMDALVDEVLAIDVERRELMTITDAMKQEQNAASKQIPQIKKAGGDISEIRLDSRAERASLLPLEMNAFLPGCVWNATPRSLSPLERNIGFWTQA